MEWEKAAEKIFPEEWKDFKEYIKKSRKGRRPDTVEFTSIEEDVLRRDLTINALFYDIEKKEIVDLVGGRKDLDSNIVRTVGEPDERFEEDALRKLRAVRFISRMDAKFDKATEDSIRKDSSLPGVSEERIFDEFSKIVKSAIHLDKAMIMLNDLGFFKSIFPGVKIDTSMIKNKMDIVLATTVLLHSNTSNTVENLLKSMKWPNELAEKVGFLISLKELSLENVMRKKRRQVILKISDSDILKMHILIKNPLLEPFSKYSLTIKGDSVQKETGLEGKALGEEIEKREREAFKKIV